MRFVCDKKIKKPANLTGYLEELKSAAKDEEYSTHESFLRLPADSLLRGQIAGAVKEKRTKNLKEVMVVGIGGSSLGALAVYEALRPDGVFLSFFDTAHARALKDAKERMRRIYRDKGEVLINFISKSGSTIETIMNARVLINELRELNNEWRSSVVVTTEPLSKLDNWAASNNITSLANPKNIVGRFSVLSAVGLFPLALCGVDVEKLRKGARGMTERCLSEDAQENPALKSALAIFDAMKRGATIHNLFVFDIDLEGLGKWYRQLVGESLGKIGKGITPIVSVGSTDMHSVYQLFIAGPKDKFTTFMRIRGSSDAMIPEIDGQLDDIVPVLNSKSVNDVMSAIYKGAKKSYENRKLPFCEVELESMREEELGAFLQFKMVETTLLARLMRVNAFDQGNVEEYKIITRKILSSS